MKIINKLLIFLVIIVIMLGISCVEVKNSHTGFPVDKNTTSEKDESIDNQNDKKDEPLDNEHDKKEEKEEPKNNDIVPLVLPDCVEPTKSLSKFVEQANDKFSAQRDGIIISPFYAVKIDSIEIPVYAVPAVNGETQNVAMLDVAQKIFPIEIEVISSNNVNSAEILPLNCITKCNILEKKITFTAYHFGYYTLQLNDSYENVLTIAIREKEEYEIPSNTNVIEYESGIHYIDYIDIPSNTTLYLHSGAMLIANPPKDDELPITGENSSWETTWRPFIQAKNVENISIIGRGVLDMSALHWGARNPIDIKGSTNVRVDGVCIVNTANWNITISNSKNVEVENIILLSTRRNSDGIAIVDCSNAVVQDCFARSGDDLFEVKSMYSQGKVPCETVVFQRCIAWSDSCRCFGVIHETSKDITDVTFQDCAVLYSLPTWSEDLGSLVVINGIRGHVSNITFKDIEVYYESGYVMNVATGPNEWSEDLEIGKVSNVKFENIVVHHGNKVRIKGVGSQSPYINSVVYKSINIEGKKINSVFELNIITLGNIGEVKYETSD